MIEAVLFFAVVIFLLAFGCIVFFGAPYVPAKLPAVRAALDNLYTLQSSDLLLDLGSGDGRVIREAARRGARAVGFELNPILVAIGKIVCRRQPNATNTVANIWTKAFPDQTTIVYVFCVSRDTKRLVDKIQKEATRLGRPIYVLSFAIELDAPLLRRDSLHFLYEIQPLHFEKHKV